MRSKGDALFWKTGLMVILLIGLLRATSATEWYVATNGSGGGTSWADATNSLQGAINAAIAATFDVVWVSNGVYDAGGITNSGYLLTNRVLITKAITVRSKDNDPTNTIIKGSGPYGPAAVRCVYMSAGSLVGFTLTNGSTLNSGNLNDRSGGGVYCPNTTPVISNCIMTCNSAYSGDVSYGGGGSFYGTLRNCTFIKNFSYYGGGAMYGVLSNCTLIGNYTTTESAIYPQGAGAARAALYNCALISNSGRRGGGACDSTLYNCTLISNSVNDTGGGVWNCSVVSGCKLISNTGSTAGGAGGGSYLYNCLLTGNYASDNGGGAAGSTLYNCTVTSNSLYYNNGAGVNSCTLYDSIVYFNGQNSTYSNWYSSTFIYGCTAPTTTTWTAGSITSDPKFVNKGGNDYRLSPRSPCINAGTNGTWTTSYPADLDGRQRVRYGTVDMGAYEHIRAGTIYGVR